MLEKTRARLAALEARLGVRTTWVGIGAALSGTASAVSVLRLPEAVSAALAIAIAISGVVAVLIPCGRPS